MAQKANTSVFAYLTNHQPMPKSKTIKYKFADNRPEGQNAKLRVVAPGKKKSDPGVQPTVSPIATK